MRDFKGTAFAFDRACRQARMHYVFVGGVAVMAWGQPRATADVDAVLLLQAEDLKHFIEALSGEGLLASAEDFRDALTDRSHVTITDPESGFHVDVKLAESPEERAEIEAGIDLPFEQGRLRVARPEETVAYKLLYGSPQDVKDVRSILVRQEGRLDMARLHSLARQLGVTEDLERVLNDVKD